jgi:DNA polymerase I-like protein with 3'-5' exonuclease and polymerase domains
LIAVYSDDPALYEIISKNLSIHDFNTVNVFFDLDCKIDDVKELYPKERGASKTFGFAGFYNAGANRIRIAFAQAGFPISELDARNKHRRFKAIYGVAYNYAQQVVQVLEKGEVITSLLGRPVKVQNPEEAFMKGFNSLIQGAASDINLYSAWQVTQACPDAVPLGFIHDSVLFEVPEGIIESADVLINQVFTGYEFQTTHGPIRLKIEGGVSDTWEK